MPPTSPPNSTKQPRIPQRITIQRSSTTKKACEQCRRRRRACNSQHPCSHCIEDNQECVYGVVSEHSRSVFSTQAARRLSSGSACETCRRRKTKCDGGNPCSFCINNQIECVNNAERRYQKKIPGETMDRIEDRLSRIEKLMTAFTPSPLSQTGDEHRIRPHRHSVHGMTVTQEQNNMKRRGSPYSPTRYGSLSPPPTSTSAALMRSPNSHASIAHSMLNLSISPTIANKPLPLTSASTPSPSALCVMPTADSRRNDTLMGNSFMNDSTVGDNDPHLPTPPSSSGSRTNHYDGHTVNNEWKSFAAIPSLMDQLSKRTFATAVVDYTVTHYPIYPLTPPTGSSRPTSPSTHL
ncbi:hypothetical protein BDB01DRAFT_772860 [Pilobolus umbonatus]|nr:hypothetical protein BDB01DRAFT_772860 [Pilobolus umbonatus]